MLSKSLIALAALFATSPAIAELAVTAPIASTVCRGGERCIIEWEDDGTGPSLADHGDCTVALYTGNPQQQTFLQPIAFPAAINVATTARIEFTVDPTIGPDDDRYFIRFSSEDLRNPDSPTNPYLSFSALFSLANMRGTFNATVLAQLEGLTSAGGASSTRGSSSTRDASTASSSSRSSSTRTSSSSSSTATNDQSDSSGFRVAPALTAVGAVTAALFALVY